MDLEDAVTPVNKTLARRQVVHFLEAKSKQGPASAPGPSVVVRVNCPVTTEWGEDDIKSLASLQRSAPQALQAIVLPKVESHGVLDRTLQLHREAGVSSPPPLWAMVETPRGVLNAAVVATHPSVECLVFGANDLTKELRARHTADRAPLALAMAQCVLAARAHGKLVLNGVFNSISDDAGLRRVCEQGRDMGFDGKSLIHPNQVAAAHTAFSPSPEEVAAAQRILDAWEAAVRERKSLAVVDGRLVEELHVLEARRVVLTARMIASSLQAGPPPAPHS
jgi:(3S)-malyl-CoA thioesterase